MRAIMRALVPAIERAIVPALERLVRAMAAATGAPGRRQRA
jgi:hypothetical protein